MSGAEQFKAAVPEQSGPTDWRGGLERSGARRGRVGRSAGGGPCGWTAIPRPRFARARKIKGNLDGRYRAWHDRDEGSFGEKLTQEIL
jgi:hypothetical protein